jgi:hypothetical protein
MTALGLTHSTCDRNVQIIQIIDRTSTKQCCIDRIEWIDRSRNVIGRGQSCCRG